MKKIIVVCLLVMMTITAAACSNTGTDSSGLPNENSTPPASSAASGQLIVGSVTDLNSDFMSGWTSGRANADAMRLIYGYSPVVYSKEGTFVVDPTVVKDGGIEVQENEDGSKTYTISLQDSLQYNDGTPITAVDYVFSILLQSSPEFAALEADATAGMDYVGYKEFNAGETKTFGGVRLLGDDQFSVTVAAEKFPYYYELVWCDVKPLPMHVLAPGASIEDTGNGATLSDNFTVDLIREPILNSESGYRYKPTVTCGPYRFVQYDPSTKQAILERNDRYLGNYEGQTPSIGKIIMKSVTTATMMDELAAGAVDLITGVSGGESIEAGLDLEEAGKVSYVHYPRAGYGKIAFSADFGPTQFQAVRQAIAYLLDRDEFARQYSGGYAKVVDGFYGLSQWEYRETKERLEKELQHYTLNPEKAKELLIADGWTLNETGGEYVEGSDSVRYKNVDGDLMPLIIEWANTPNNPVSDLLSTMLPSEMQKVGMKLNATTVEFGVLQNHINRQGIDQPKYHMFNLATSFAEANSPWYYYSTDPQFFGLYNTNFIQDAELEQLALAMKATEPGDEETWVENWLAFQKRWNEVLPDIPLYSDDYHDFFTTKLTGYDAQALWNWTNAILYASLTA